MLLILGSAVIYVYNTCGCIRKTVMTGLNRKEVWFRYSVRAGVHVYKDYIVSFCILDTLNYACQLHILTQFAISVYGEYRISGIFRVGKFWQKRYLGDFRYFKDSQWRRLVAFILRFVYFSDFREVAKSAKIKPTRKIPDIRSILFLIEVSLCRAEK